MGIINILLQQIIKSLEYNMYQKYATFSISKSIKFLINNIRINTLILKWNVIQIKAIALKNNTNQIDINALIDIIDTKKSLYIAIYYQEYINY